MNFFVIIFSSFLSTIFGYLRQKFTYWDFQEVKQLKTHFLVGNFFKLKTVHHSALLQEVYEAFRGKVRLAGTYIFTKPVAVVLDLELAKNVLITDADKFLDPSEVPNLDEQYLSKRSKLDQMFTAENMNFIYPNIRQVCLEFDKVFEKQQNGSLNEVEVSGLAESYISDVFGTSMFGIECNNLHNKVDEFRSKSKVLFGQRLGVKTFLLLDTYPILKKILRIKRDDDFLNSYLKPLLKKSVELRESSHDSRNDFIDLAKKLIKSGDFTIQELSEYLYTIYKSSYVSSVSTLSQSLYELAKNSQVQDKLRAEILNVSKSENDELTYESIMNMPYLQQVITETLRLHPSQASISRCTNVEYKIPDTTISIEKGTHMMIPVRAIHLDPEIYEQPEEFRPERFSKHESDKRHSQAFLGWGSGERNHIGMLYTRLQISAALITLLRRRKFSLCSSSPKQIQPKNEYVTLVPNAEIWLKVETL